MIDELIDMWNPTVERCGVILPGGEVREVRNFAVDLGYGGGEFAMKTKHVQEAMGSVPLDRLMGMWHTHPSNSPRPSDADVSGWPVLPRFASYLVVTSRVVTEWKLVGPKPVLVSNRSRSSVARRVSQTPG